MDVWRVVIHLELCPLEPETISLPKPLSGPLFSQSFKRPCGISPRLIFFLSGCRPISGRDACPPRTMNSTWASDLYGYEYERMLIILHYCVSVNNYVIQSQFAINCGKILHGAIRLLHPSCSRLLGRGKEVEKPNGTWTENLNVSSDISHPYELLMFIVLLCTRVLAFYFYLSKEILGET